MSLIHSNTFALTSDQEDNDDGIEAHLRSPVRSCCARTYQAFPLESTEPRDTAEYPTSWHESASAEVVGIMVAASVAPGVVLINYRGYAPNSRCNGKGMSIGPELLDLGCSTDHLLSTSSCQMMAETVAEVVVVVDTYRPTSPLSLPPWTAARLRLQHRQLVIKEQLSVGGRDNGGGCGGG
ncbi:hypothetical protein J6590_034426 [Homalodisca vitripennis]|nr:hypothetical protein J6590_034426 [Homalodisca vitripennis]